MASFPVLAEIIKSRGLGIQTSYVQAFSLIKTFQNNKVVIDSLLVIAISIARKNQERDTPCHKFKLQLLTIHLRCL